MPMTGGPAERIPPAIKADAGPDADCAACAPSNGARDYAEIAAAFLALFGLLLALNYFDLLPRGFAISESMTYGVVFLIGLAASVSTCVAVTGGLLVAIAAKYNEASGPASSRERILPHVCFNAGRILAYALFGGLIGAIGSALIVSPGLSGALMLAASAVMIVIGLQILRILPSFGLARSFIPGTVANRVRDLSARRSKPAAFLLGASTFFLPCGFTQALQLYVLAKGDPALGAMTMLVFALGTLPALSLLSAMSSIASGNFQRYFLKAAGVAVVFLGLLNIHYGLVLTGSPINAASVAETFVRPARVAEGRAPIVDGYQTVDMTVVGLEYQPNQFTVTQGVPVVWQIDAREAEGCGRIIIVPKLRVRRFLSATEPTVIAFTPDTPGEIEFNCGMGMMTPNSKFKVVAPVG
jgi:uncharacterized protein